ncbi:glycosyltransferase family 2 protein [Actinomycetospora flava]|uniref:Glycosyltransferase family 2 protein n=1 Tax=Actinomycetospora flava TaxID=3129232 RepID=A0ABU8MAB7_9PSEU
MTPPTVTVVVPVHGAAEHIVRCLTSLARQDRGPDQVVLVDDRGPDDSIPRAVAAAGVLDLDVTVVTHPENRGLGAARNTGLAATTGDAVLFLDADDELRPDGLALLADALRRHDADFAASRTVTIRPDGTELAEVERPYRREVVPGRAYARGLLRDRHRAYAGNKLFRRAALPAEMWDVGRAYEDFAPVLYAARRAARVALVDTPVYRYTVHPTSISRRWGRHTTDLLAVGDDVRRALAGPSRDRTWRRDAAVYGVLNVALPVANMALRARAADPAASGVEDAVTAARRQVGPYALGALALEGRLRPAAAAAVLRLSPAAYARVLAVR